MTYSDISLYTDASLHRGISAAGAWCIQSNHPDSRARILELNSIDLLHCGNPLCLTDINAAELYTLKVAIRRTLRWLRSIERLTIYTDSQPALHAISGSATFKAPEISRWVEDIRYSLSVGPLKPRYTKLVWIPRSQNKVADYLSGKLNSRLKDADSVTLSYSELGAVSRSALDSSSTRRVRCEEKEGTRKIVFK